MGSTWSCEALNQKKRKNLGEMKKRGAPPLFRHFLFLSPSQISTKTQLLLVLLCWGPTRHSDYIYFVLLLCYSPLGKLLESRWVRLGELEQKRWTRCFWGTHLYNCAFMHTFVARFEEWKGAFTLFWGSKVRGKGIWMSSITSPREEPPFREQPIEAYYGKVSACIGTTAIERNQI